MNTRRERRPRRAGLNQRCAFCDRKIPPTDEVFGFGIKAKPGADLENRRGQITELAVGSLGRKVLAVVTGTESPAAQAGFDLYLMTCSAACANDLKAALEQDIGGQHDV
ncbi:MAG: hypothetical protein ACYDCC_08995 [Actinomycetota bacterium]